MSPISSDEPKTLFSAFTHNAEGKHLQDDSEKESCRSLSGARYEQGSLVSGVYRLERLLGQGGMGAVWLAHDERLRCEVALKLARGDVSLPLARERFLLEATTSLSLDHPAIVQVFDLGESEHGDPFIVMEVLDGHSLAAHLSAQGRLPSTEAVRLILPVLAALEAIHSQGLLYGDLKPDNIMLVTRNGRIFPKLIDFGTATSLRPSRRLGVMGSPGYMAPELARGDEKLDARADVWATSVMLYELVTGQRPFERASHEATISAIASTTPAAITSLGAGDSALWSILERGLRKSREERFASVRVMATELIAWGLQRGVFDESAVSCAAASKRQEVRASCAETPTVPELILLPQKPAGRRWLAIGLSLLTLVALSVVLAGRHLPRLYPHLQGAASLVAPQR